MEKKNVLVELALLVGLTGGLTVGLHLLGSSEALRIDWADPVGWLDNATAEEAIGATLRTVGLAIGYWITISTCLYAIATKRRTGRPPRLLTLLTLPGVRRVVDRALAAALTASLAAAPLTPALADEPQPPPVVFDTNSDGIPVPHVIMENAPRASSDDTPTEKPPVEPLPIPQPVMAPGTAPEVALGTVQAATVAHATTTTAAYTVQLGDNLWRIAERQVKASAEGEPVAATITAYWREVVTANHGTLRSGDPNLIFPGEIVELPVYEVSP